MKTIERVIKEVTDGNMDDSIAVVRDSFRTVADDLGITRENCPRHPSFITTAQLQNLRAKGVKFFGLFLDGRQAGFVAVEKVDETLYYMEKLAVLPQYRQRGCGRELVDFVIDYIRDTGAKKLAIGTWDRQTELKSWYQGLGFEEVSTKDFDHLPFTVCFMEMDVS